MTNLDTKTSLARIGLRASLALSLTCTATCSDEATPIRGGDVGARDTGSSLDAGHSDVGADGSVPTDGGTAPGSGIVADYDINVLAELGSPNRPSCRPTDVNDAGTIVGECCASTSPEDRCDCVGFVYDGTYAELAAPAGFDGVHPAVINDRGDIGGYLWTCGETNQAFVRATGGAIVDLNERPSTGLRTYTRVVDLDDDGRAVGRYQSQTSSIRGSFFYELDDDSIDLLAVDGALAMHLGPEGRVVGSRPDESGDGRAFVWSRADGASALAVPGVDDLKLTRANRIHASGRIGGFAVRGPGLANFTLPLLWNDGEVEVLPHDDRMASVVDFSVDGVPIGTCSVYDPDLEASFALGCFWEDGQRLFFEDRVVDDAWKQTLYHVGGTEAVNDRGVLVGRAYDRTLTREAVYRTFVLTPVEGEGTSVP